MKKTDRLLSLLQILRSSRFPVSGETLALELGISIRTLYRDISDLRYQGADIEGEPGLGFVLKPGFFLPPLMFSQEEMDALILGGLWVSTFGDKGLSRAAKNALSKITEVLPSKMKKHANSIPLRVGPPPKKMIEEDLSLLREAIRNEWKIEILYSLNKLHTVWPFTIGYFSDKRILVSWDGEKNEFKFFKTDKITKIKTFSEKCPRSKESLFKEWRELEMKKQRYEPT